MDPFNRNQAQRNIYRVDFELIRLQRERKITIRLFDKGAGMLVTNFEDYL